MATNDSACRAVLVSLRRIIRAVDCHSRALAQKHGLTGPQLVVLSELASAREIRVGELARKISLSHATVSGVLDRLEKRGLVSRIRGGSDRRIVTVGLTESGRVAQGKAPPLLQEEFLSEFGKLGEEEQTQILSALQRVASMMSADKLDATPILVSGPPAASAKSTAEFLGQTEGAAAPRRIAPDERRAMKRPADAGTDGQAKSQQGN